MLIDTSGWFSIFDLRDTRHSKATELYNSAIRKVTHSYVVAEFVALSEARKRHRTDMLEFLSFILADGEITVVWVNERLNSRALELLQNRVDKAWSLCDAVSFVLMDDLQITESLSTDKHFEQAGFVKLLES